jgi:thymidylate synthase (methanogen type)
VKHEHTAGDDVRHLPQLLVEAETCGEAWEKAVEKVWRHGIEIEQHYQDQLSREASVLINVTNPLKEPRFSKKDGTSVAMFLLGDAKKKPYREKQYVRDLLDGDMDHRVEQGVESYTYHERLWRWGGIKNPKHIEIIKQKDGILVKLHDPSPNAKCRDRAINPEYDKREKAGINQLAMLIAKALKEPISRKLQVTTWQPNKDLLISGAPCLQRIWIRIIKKKYMVMETHWRSRDLYKAWGPNVVGMVEIGKWIADQIGVEFTQYADHSNSLHLYKSDYKELERHFHIIEARKEREEEIKQKIDIPEDFICFLEAIASQAQLKIVMLLMKEGALTLESIAADEDQREVEQQIKKLELGGVVQCYGHERIFKYELTKFGRQICSDLIQSYNRYFEGVGHGKPK